jgi:replicative DNA helicase
MINSAEQNVIGALLNDPTAIDKVVGILKPSDFTDQNHGETYSKILDLSNNGEPVDIFTVTEGLKNSKVDLAYISQLQINTPSASNVAIYAKSVKNKSTERQLRAAANKIVEYCDSGFSIEEKIDKASNEIFSIAENRFDLQDTAKPIQEILRAVVDSIDRRHQKGGEITGLSTGFNQLDKSTTGLHGGDLIVIAGRPSMGKTTFAMNIVEAVAVNQNMPAAVFSLEMPADQLGERFTSSLSRVQFQSIRTGKIADEDWPKLTFAMGKYAESKIFIDDSAGLSVLELKARSRRLKREHGIKLIVVDYLQLMQADGENQTQRIGSISRGLKSLAKELNVPVIALSQLNRSLEQRQNKRPMMSDLRDSGDIEQDADVIIFIYREEVYKPHTSAKNVAEAIIGKQRNGPRETVPLTFFGDIVRFENYSGPPLSIIYREQLETNYSGGRDHEGFN